MKFRGSTTGNARIGGGWSRCGAVGLEWASGGGKAESPREAGEIRGVGDGRGVGYDHQPAVATNPRGGR